MENIYTLQTWLRRKNASAALKRRNDPGHRVAFEGTDKAAKWAAAEKLGGEMSKPVYRIGLAEVAGKYIGETEKNLRAAFEQAAGMGAILYLDEADALFGKRTEVKDAHDKYAHIEVASLVQKLESYPGVVILATEQKGELEGPLARSFRKAFSFPKR